MTLGFSLDDGSESSLRGAKRRSNPGWRLTFDCATGLLSGLLRFARNDGSAIDDVFFLDDVPLKDDIGDDARGPDCGTLIALVF
jgi:hypothetical protein